MTVEFLSKAGLEAEICRDVSEVCDSIKEGSAALILAEEALPVAEITREEAEMRLKRAHDALMLADTFGVRVTAEHDVRAAEAMVEAVDAYEKAQGRTH